MQIHIDRGGERFGPYSLEDVNRYLADGTLLPSDLGWHDGAMDWVPLPQVQGVNAGGPPPAPPGGPPAPTAADAAGASSAPGPPASPTAADAAGPKFSAEDAAAPEAGGGKGAILKIVAIVALVAGLGAGGYFLYPTIKGYFAGADGGDNNGTDGNGTKGSGNGTKAIAASTPAKWESLPDGALIVGDADAVAQIKVGAIYSTPLVQSFIRKDRVIVRDLTELKRTTGLGPEDIVDLTISASGITQAATSVKELDDSEFEDAFENAWMRGFRSKDADLNSGEFKGQTDLMMCGVLRLRKNLNATPLISEIEKHRKRANAWRAKSAEERGKPPPEEIPDPKKTHDGTTYYYVQENSNPPAGFSFYFPDPKTVVIGPERMIIAHIDSKGSAQPRQGLETLNPRQMLTVAYVPPDPTKLQSFIADAVSKIGDNAPPQVMELAESLKDANGASLNANLAQAGLYLMASINFPDGSVAQNFAGKVNQLFNMARQDSDTGLAQQLVAAQGMGIQIPSAPIKAANNQASFTLGIPNQAISSAIALAGPARHSETTMKRWSIVMNTVGQNNWPNYKIVMQAIGKPDNIQQNAVMNIKAILNDPDGGAVMQQLTESARVTAQRWDYFNDPQRQRAIQLYFNPQTGQLVGVNWFESGRKIGPPGGHGHSGSGGDGPPDEEGPPGEEDPGGEDESSVFQRGNGVTSPSRPTATTRTFPQTPTQAEKFLAGEWSGTTGGTRGVKVVFKNPQRVESTGGSRPISGRFQVLQVSGNQMMIWAITRANVTSLSLNGPDEIIIGKTVLQGFVPPGSYRRN